MHKCVDTFPEKIIPKKFCIPHHLFPQSVTFEKASAQLSEHTKKVEDVAMTGLMIQLVKEDDQVWSPPHSAEGGIEAASSVERAAR